MPCHRSSLEFVFFFSVFDSLILTMKSRIRFLIGCAKKGLDLRQHQIQLLVSIIIIIIIYFLLLLISFCD
jgi:uncharacterized membrane protein YidH (DUF202 family)